MKLNKLRDQLLRIRDLHQQVVEATTESSDDWEQAWADDVAAIDELAAMLTTLAAEGVHDLDGLKDLLHDYRSLEQERKAMHQKFEVPAKPLYFAQNLLCPDCNHRVGPGHSHCHWCGKKLQRS